MATEAVPQASLDPQHDADLINYDADVSATGQSWPFANTGTDSQQVEAGDLAADSFQNQSEMTVEGVNEIDWEDPPQGSEEPTQTGISDGDHLAAPPLDAGMKESGFTLSAEPVSTGTAQEGGWASEEKATDELRDENNSHEMGGDEGMVEHEITYDEDDHVESAKEDQNNIENHDMKTGISGGDDVSHTEAHAEVETTHDADTTGGDEVDEEVEVSGEDEFEVHDDKENDGVDHPADHDNPSAEQSQDDSGLLTQASLDITVTYKNAEYPLVHGQDNIETQMGFFEDASALDLTIDNLLAKFREELTDDIGPEDEVVLQVDELGLEYAESTHRDHLSGVTLRQLHEIFDQLAKNQEPDATRTLYTNLILRPHPAKRLEMLIDEAFNGKGLDEVMYCFQPNTSEQQPQGDEDEEMYESSDNEGAQSVEAEDEDASLDEAVQDENEGESQPEYQEEPNMEAGDDDGGDADGDIEQYEEFADLDDTSVPPQAPQPQEPIQIPDDGDDELDIVEVDGTDLAGSTAQNDAYGSDNFGVGQNAEGDITLADNSGFDLVEIADDDDVLGADAAERSATATLTGDVVNEIDFEDNDINDIANADVYLEGAAADPSNEIDWRDFTEEAEIGVKEALSPSVKRPRPDGDDGEDALLDGQNDVKRRRS